MHHCIAQPLHTSVTALPAHMRHLTLLSVLKKQSTGEKAPLVQRALTHKFPLPASGQTPHAFKLLSVWKTNADEAPHLLCVGD